MSQTSMSSAPTYTVATAVGPSVSSTASQGNTPLTEFLSTMARKTKCSFQTRGLPAKKKHKGDVKTSQSIGKAKLKATDLHKNPPKDTASTSTAAALRNNRFAALVEEADNIMEQDLSETGSEHEDAAPAVSNGNKAISRPPAICVPNVDNPASMERALDSCVGENNYSIAHLSLE